MLSLHRHLRNSTLDLAPLEMKVVDILVKPYNRTQYVHIYSFVSIQQNHRISS